MIYGIEVDAKYLHAMSEFQDVPIDKITTADMARVAKQLKSKYQDQAQKRQAELKGEYGTGVCVVVRVYNATGGPLVVKETADFRGHFGAQAIEHRIPNGTWTVFIHVHTAGAAKGAAGAVVLKNDKAEFFAGWQNPWNRSWDSQVVVEVFEPGHWWSVGSKDYMLSLLDAHESQTSEYKNLGFYMFGSTGNETTAYVEYLCEMA
ncbi:hypothetical protein B0H12DRAFT_705954 [Mycena haematopus]|nr:hypothetical protein B0H12DRAFT_332028 [Mycena haematopus]KAJ7249076.1 hypothetical protein B0H12DRAFT_705954 [Mycena haematopus]